jgi:methylenetetrahydrofolate dehydrogenase (NADP+)/methenyltetrahydrofolate cyclohydrolase
MLLSAKSYVDYKIEQQAKKVAEMEVKPKLCILQVEGDKASDRYVANKMKRCDAVGIEVSHILMPNNIQNEGVASIIEILNETEDVTGILLQLPLPKHLDEDYLTNLIIPEKDVDGFTINNTGKLSLGNPYTVPCTAKGIMDLLDYYNIDVCGRDVLIINRSNIVGKPLAQLMLQRNATVTIAHSHTEYLKEKIKQADIVVTGVGIPKFLNKDDFSSNTVIIDVSINFVDGKMCGDVNKDDYDEITQCSALTPVPGGVGQTTVIALIDNLIYMQQNK